MRFIEFIREAAQAAKPAAKKPATSAKGKKPSSSSKGLEDKHVAITFGRFNPPHAGHGKLLDAVKAHGGDSGNYRIYPSRSQDHKKNPLSAHQKVDHMRKLFPHHKDAIQNNEAHRNIFDILRDLHDEGHEHVTMVVGDDRVKEFENLTKKYNGVHYDFKSINIKSAGARSDNSDDPIENLSASKMRAHASSGDHDSFHAGMPKGVSKKHSQKLLQDVLAGMTPPPPKAKGKKKKEESIHEQSLWEYAPKLDFDAFRNHYMLDHIFKVGALVEHDDTGLRGNVVHRGTNYVIFQMPDGNEHRAWLQHVTEVRDASDTSQDQSNYSADDGSGNTWKVGTDEYRMAVQNMTPGQEVKKFSQFNAEIRKTATTK